MFWVEQLVYLWVEYVLLLEEEVTLHFLEMALRHLQLSFPQGTELFPFGLVALMFIGVVRGGGSGYCLSLALTNAFARLSALLKLRHGLGTIPSSWSLGLRIFLSSLVFRSGV